MPIVSKKYGYMFICKPGTGSSVTSNALRKGSEGVWFPEKSVVDVDGNELANWKHATVPQLLNTGLIPKASLKKLFVFVTVRNPYDFWPSEWLRFQRWSQFLEDPDHWINRDANMQKKVRDSLEMSFDEFVSNELKRPHYRYINRLRRALGRAVWGLQPWSTINSLRHLSIEYLLFADRFLRFENLQADLDTCLDSHNIPRVELWRGNVTENRDRDFRTYYSEASRQLVYRKFKDDFIKFGYTFEPSDTKPVVATEPKT
ncbi:MAG: sulfotransferase family 2 domain-containing protein [Verrucomicrobia bacterium]|jgi:hypothetical protein|nr:sulfotransferase family 2 domain-containing protein [Verrucomicrobiota bacterium]